MVSFSGPHSCIACSRLVLGLGKYDYDVESWEAALKQDSFDMNQDASPIPSNRIRDWLLRVLPGNFEARRKLFWYLGHTIIFDVTVREGRLLRAEFSCFATILGDDSKGTDIQDLFLAAQVPVTDKVIFGVLKVHAIPIGELQEGKGIQGEEITMEEVVQGVKITIEVASIGHQSWNLIALEGELPPDGSGLSILFSGVHRPLVWRNINVI